MTHVITQWPQPNGCNQPQPTRSGVEREGGCPCVSECGLACLSATGVAVWCLRSRFKKVWQPHIERASFKNGRPPTPQRPPPPLPPSAFANAPCRSRDQSSRPSPRPPVHGSGVVGHRGARGGRQPFPPGDAARCHHR